MTSVRILGAGWYGCHLALALSRAGFDVEVHEKADRIFAGASGHIPARLHGGAHYPRSHKTRAACQRHTSEFLAVYGHLTRGVPVNLYAIASDESLVDFDQYAATLRGEFPFIPVFEPAEFGLQHVEGAILTGERHILADKAAQFFEREIGHLVAFNVNTDGPTSHDWTIDCTFCSASAVGVDRYEPCLVLLMEGATDRAVTIMDGPFPSLYPWDEERGLCSLSSAKWTPFSKDIKTYADALASLAVIRAEPQARYFRQDQMIASMRHFYPAIDDFRVVDHMLSIRAMPLSGADTRLVDVREDGRTIRVRAGKIDAVLDAERAVMDILK